MSLNHRALEVAFNLTIHSRNNRPYDSNVGGRGLSNYEICMHDLSRKEEELRVEKGEEGESRGFVCHHLSECVERNFHRSSKAGSDFGEPLF